MKQLIRKWCWHCFHWTVHTRDLLADGVLFECQKCMKVTEGLRED